MARHTLTGDTKEDLRDIEGFPHYKIDRTGKIVSFCGITPRILRTYLNNKGYVCIDLRENGKREHKLVHRLVAEAFIDNPDSLPEVNHKDEDKTNNFASNLEWMSQEDNVAYSQPRWAKRSVQMFDKSTGELLATFPSLMEAVRVTGINQSNICSCCLGKLKSAGGYVWKYLTTTC